MSLEGPGRGEFMVCRKRWVVGEEHLARHLAERGRKVLSTPCMVLMIEATARECLDRVLDGKTTVGYRVDVKHRRPVGLGEEVVVEARIIEFDGRRALVYARVTGPDGSLVGEAFHERFVTE